MNEANSKEFNGLFYPLEAYSKDNKILMYRTIIRSMSGDIESVIKSKGCNKCLGHKIKGTSEIIGADKLVCLAKNYELAHEILNLNNAKESLVKEMLGVIEAAKYKLEILINEK